MIISYILTRVDLHGREVYFKGLAPGGMIAVSNRQDDAYLFVSDQTATMFADKLNLSQKPIKEYPWLPSSTWAVKEIKLETSI